MAPKVRRPAAKAAVAKPKAKPKAKGKAKARARVRLQPGGLAGILRRPASKRGRSPGKKEEAKDGDLKSSEVDLEKCRTLRDIEIVEGSYWEADVNGACRVLHTIVENGEIHLVCQVQGTESEVLLKAASGIPGRRMKIHLCREECPGTPHQEDLIHARVIREIKGQKDGWMTNLVEDPRGADDELANLRAEMEARESAKRKKKEGEEKKDGEESTTEGEEAPKKKKKKKKKKKELKIDMQKDVKEILKRTGVDPDPDVRKKFRRKAAKMARKKKGGGSATSSSGSGEDSGDSLADHTMFGSSGKVMTIHRRLPGALASAALEEAAEALITMEGGTWDVYSGPLPALFTRYYRQQLQGRMSPAMSREAHTISRMMDCVLQGQLGQMLDLGAQRLKSLELMSMGAHYTVAQEVEVLGKEQTSMSSTVEVQEAAKRAREASKSKLDSSRPYGARAAGGAPSENWNNKGPKKGNGKGKNQKGGGKGGDRDKAEANKGQNKGTGGGG